MDEENVMDASDEKGDKEVKNSHILPTGQWYAPSAVSYFALSFTILHHVSPSCTILHHVEPCCTILHHVEPCCTMLHHIAP